MARPEAALFDVDGTLVDSVDLHARAWQEALRKFGKDVSVDEVRRVDHPFVREYFARAGAA